MQKFLRFALLFFISASCQEVFLVGQLPEDNPVPQLDFDYRISQSFSGMVKFNNLSVGMEKYQWDLGYNDAQGSQTVLMETAPTVFFPANGSYRIVLKGYDSDGNDYRITKIIEVNNVTN